MTEVNRPKLSNLGAMYRMAAEQKEIAENYPVDPADLPRDVLKRVLKYLAASAGVPFTKFIPMRDMASTVSVTEPVLVQILDSAVYSDYMANRLQGPLIAQLARIRRVTDAIAPWLTQAIHRAHRDSYKDQPTDELDIYAAHRQIEKTYNMWFVDPLDRAVDHYVKVNETIARNKEVEEFIHIPMYQQWIAGWMHRDNFNPEACKPHNWKLSRSYDEESGKLWHLEVTIGDNLVVHFINQRLMPLDVGLSMMPAPNPKSTEVHASLRQYFSLMGFQQCPTEEDSQVSVFEHPLLPDGMQMHVVYIQPN